MTLIVSNGVRGWGRRPATGAGAIGAVLAPPSSFGQVGADPAVAARAVSPGVVFPDEPSPFGDQLSNYSRWEDEVTCAIGGRTPQTAASAGITSLAVTAGGGIAVTTESVCITAGLYQEPFPDSSFCFHVEAISLGQVIHEIWNIGKLYTKQAPIEIVCTRKTTAPVTFPIWTGGADQGPAIGESVPSGLGGPCPGQDCCDV
jgi:hypothetical protein